MGKSTGSNTTMSSKSSKTEVLALWLSFVSTILLALIPVLGQAFGVGTDQPPTEASVPPTPSDLPDNPAVDKSPKAFHVSAQGSQFDILPSINLPALHTVNLSNKTDESIRAGVFAAPATGTYDFDFSATTRILPDGKNEFRALEFYVLKNKDVARTDPLASRPSGKNDNERVTGHKTLDLEEGDLVKLEAKLEDGHGYVVDEIELQIKLED